VIFLKFFGLGPELFASELAAIAIAAMVNGSLSVSGSISAIVEFDVLDKRGVTLDEFDKLDE
jgi:uncharacterized membrane-anchored protein